ncbi:extracellular solute-binding protein [Paenibacillus kobensis]|uniref:extracellular solute-binding protein n=1 Tax=Paenibacillus kobensis TaxID=59841 RepID=UPI0013E366FC|nr:extracellular solute-binding protein [Paenibacillus kobensis]
MSGRRWVGAAVLVMILSVCAACSSESGPAKRTQAETSDEDRAYGKYETPVTLRVAFSIPESRLAAGDTNDNNPVSRYLEKLTNIKVVHAWEAKSEDDFKLKADFAIAAQDLPDAMVVDRNQLKKLIENGLAEDLTEIYKEYASSLVKAMIDSTQGLAYQDASSDGKLFGVPNVAIEADAPSLLWVRKDWLDRLNLKPPTTLADIGTIAQAFVERDPDNNGKRDTVGLTGTKTVVYGQKPNVNGFDTIFSTYHAFPKNWITDNAGNIVYGSIAPENKEALSLLANWYRKGWIDPQFVLYKDTEKPIIDNRTGLFFGPWWMPYWPLSAAVATDTKAEWRAYAVPLDSQGKYMTHAAPVTDRYLVVRKGYPHPEAVIRLLNVFTRLERWQDPHTAEVRELQNYAAQTGIQLRHYYPFDLLLDYSGAIEERADNVKEALAGNLDPDKFDPDTRTVYDSALQDKENPKKNIDTWKTAYSYLEGGIALKDAPIMKVRSLFYGMTPTMETKWDDLQKLENETFLQIIVGDKPIDAFDDFVQEWKANGGDQITKEVESTIKGDALPDQGDG